jgi:hypothetical protein
MCSEDHVLKSVVLQKDTHHRHLVSSLPSLEKSAETVREQEDTKAALGCFDGFLSGRRNCREFYLGSLLCCPHQPRTVPRSRLRKPLQTTGQTKEFSLVFGSPELPEMPFWGSIL